MIAIVAFVICGISSYIKQSCSSFTVQFLYYFCFVYHAGGPLDFGTADKISIFELLNFLLNNDEKEKESSRSIVWRIVNDDETIPFLEKFEIFFNENCYS